MFYGNNVCTCPKYQNMQSYYVLCTKTCTHTRPHLNMHTCTLALIQRSSVNLAQSYPAATHREGLMLCLQWFVCLGVTIALSILGGWHVYLISVSETTIEFYTNKRDARNMRKEGKVGTKQSLII